MQPSIVAFGEPDDDRVRAVLPQLYQLGINTLTEDKLEQRFSAYFEYLGRLRFAYSWPESLRKEYLSEPLVQALLQTACSDANAVVAGAESHSDHVLRTALRILGMKSNCRFVCSSTLVIRPGEQPPLSFADCSVVAEPKVSELATIAAEAAHSHVHFTGENPVVAFISFSTGGEREHYRIRIVREALQEFQRKHPHIESFGEMQLDAALDPYTAARKCPHIDGAGKANVLIFPNMDAGNIAFKMARHLAGCKTVGPIVHGLKKPLIILPRSCNEHDILNSALAVNKEIQFDAQL